MKNTLDRKWLAALLGTAFFLAFVAGPALAEERFEERFAKTETLAKNGKLYVGNLSGNITVETWKEAQVKVEALKTSRARTLDRAKENASLVTIEVTKTADVLEVVTKYPERRGGFWGGNSINVSVDYKIWVPEQASVEVRSTSGNVNVAAIGGKAVIGCTSGDVELLGAAGAEVDVTSGDLTLSNIAGDLFIKGVSGNIDVTKVRGSIEAGTVSGDMDFRDVSEAQKVSATSISGDITYAGTIKPGGRYVFDVHSGNIVMTIPADSSFELQANVFHGDIASEFDVQVVGKLSPREIGGTVGKGGATVRLKAFSGSIDLKKR